MFATLMGGYPFDPLPGVSRSFAAARDDLAKGHLDADAFAHEADHHLRQIVAEQSNAGLDLVEDAWSWVPETRAGPGLTGVAAGLLDDSLTPDRLVGAWRRLAGVAPGTTKVALPGPWTLAAGRAGEERLRDALAALVAAGCPMVLLVEPALASVGADLAAWRRVAASLETTCRDAAGRIHLSLSIPGGAPEPEGYPVLTGGLFASHHVDVTVGRAAWRYLGSIPGDRGVIVGVVRADTSELDDPEVLLWAGALAAARDGRGTARVGIAPAGSLAPVDRHHARRKIERMGTALELARMGPLDEVARALHADPAVAPIPALRSLIADHDAVLPAIDRPRSPR